MKGITPIVAIIILLLITIALAGFAYSYLTVYTTSINAKAVQVKDAFCQDGTARIAIQNIGTQQIFISDTITPIYQPEPDEHTVVLYHFDEDQSYVGDVQGSQAAHYILDTNAQDSSGNANHGAPLGSPVFGQGIKNGGIQLDGVDDRIVIANDPLLDIGAGDFTLNAWIYPLDLENSDPQDDNNDAIYAKYQDPNNFFYFRFRDSNKLQFLGVIGGMGYDKTVTSLNFPFDKNTWYMLTIIFNRTSDMIYVYNNATLAGNQSLPVTTSLVFSPAGAASISAKNSGAGWDSYFRGTIDEFTIYNRALSQHEINQLYKTLITDYSGNGNHASCSGAECPEFYPDGGKFSGAFNYSATTTRFIVPDNPTLNPQSFSIEAWYRPLKDTYPAESAQTIVAKGVFYNDNVDYWVRFNAPENQSQCLFNYSYNGGLNSKRIKIAGPDNSIEFEGEYHYVACAYDDVNKRLDLYHDGELANSSTWPGSVAAGQIVEPDAVPLDSSGGLGIGWFPPEIPEGEYFAGFIDEVRISDVALSEQDIEANWAYTCTGTGNKYTCGDLTITKISDGTFYPGFDDGAIDVGDVTVLLDPNCGGVCEYRILSSFGAIPVHVRC